MYEVQYVPLALTFFLFLVGLFLFIVVLIQLHVLQYVYAKLGLSTGAALVVERESQCSRPRLASEGMTLKVAPSFAEFPLYDADIQHSSAFLAPVNISPKLFELPMGSSSSRPSIIFQSRAA
jgi:uncharacterized membrane protein